MKMFKYVCEKGFYSLKTGILLHRFHLLRVIFLERDSQMAYFRIQPNEVCSVANFVQYRRCHVKCMRFWLLEAPATSCLEFLGVQLSFSQSVFPVSC